MNNNEVILHSTFLQLSLVGVLHYISYCSESSLSLILLRKWVQFTYCFDLTVEGPSVWNLVYLQLLSLICFYQTLLNRVAAFICVPFPPKI